MEPRGDITKLPRWVRDYIQVLVSEKARLERELSANDIVNPRVSWKTILNEPHGLPADTTIAFNTSGGRVDVQLKDDDILEIYGQDAINVIPRAANHVRIEIRERK